MNPIYQPDAPVEFNGRRPGQILTGVVISGPAGKHERYEVRCTDGRSYGVPAGMLRPGKVTASTAASLAAAGKTFQTERAECKDKRASRVAARCVQHIDSYGLRPRMRVKNRGAMLHPEVEILEVDRETGRCLVTNWKAELREKVRHFAADLGRLEKAKATVWLQATNLYPV